MFCKFVQFEISKYHIRYKVDAYIAYLLGRLLALPRNIRLG
jgi:hypothetical protein